MGGLSKKASQLKTLRSNQRTPQLTLDGGNLLFKGKSTPGRNEQARLTAATIVEAYNRMGYQAVGIGTGDLSGGSDFLHELAVKSKFTWLSANLVYKKTTRPLFPDHLSLVAGKLRIAIIGLTNHLRPTASPLENSVELKPWREVLPGVMAGLLPAPDMVILLTDYESEECRAIAAATPGISLIIAAGSNASNITPQQFTDHTLLAQTGSQGKYLGVMNIAWLPSHIWSSAPQSRDGEAQPDQDNFAVARENPGSPAAEATFRNRFIAMESGQPDDPEVKELLNQANRKLNAIGPEGGRREIPSRPPGLVGWQRCQGCHPHQTDNWLTSRHATAYATLVERQQQSNPECLSCHVTSLATAGPVEITTLPPDLKQVGCESCHGPGTPHLAEPSSTRPPPVTQAVCLTCHTPEHDGNFDYARDLQKLHCLRP